MAQLVEAQLVDQENENRWVSLMSPEERNERMDFLRRSLKYLTLVQAAYLVIRTVWHLVPEALGEVPLTRTGPWIFCGGIVTMLLYNLGSGGGRVQHERDWLLQVYFVAAYLLMAECGLLFYSYHAMWPKDRLYPELLARHSASWQLGWPAERVRLAGQVFEAVMDVCGLVALGLGAFATRELCLLKREVRRQAAAAAKEAENEQQAEQEDDEIDEEQKAAEEKKAD